MDMDRRITVTGKATMAVPADITQVNTVVTGKEDTFDKAILKMTQMTISLKDAVASAGIPRSELKTSSLSVRQAYRKKRVGSDRYGDRFEDIPDGFEFSQNVSFEFPNDNEKLSLALKNILDRDITPRISFGFRNSDPRSFQMRCLEQAARNAREEAETIVSALGAKLGKILSVDRDTRRDNHFDSICCETTIGSYASEDLEVDIEPENIAEEQSVTVVWEIDY